MGFEGDLPQGIEGVGPSFVEALYQRYLTDPSSVDDSFRRYFESVERTVGRYGGRVHSTAGDGVTAAFDHPQQAFGAAKNIQAGLLELNAFRNKIGEPIVLRQGIHTGAAYHITVFHRLLCGGRGVLFAAVCWAASP